MSSSDRRKYLTATVLNQALLDESQDNLECRLELTVDISTGLAAPNDFIRVSDRPKYVGSTYYDNRLVFPIISRTVGEWLSTELEFSVQTLELNNADGEFDRFLPGGGDYDGFIGKSVEIKLGLRDVASTYTTIFRGTISDVGGFSRTVRSIIITARDDWEKLSVSFPNTVLESTSFPNIGTGVAGIVLPYIYGDFTAAGNPKTDNASVPAYVVNEQDVNMNGEPDDTTPRTVDVELYISENDNRTFDTTGVYLKRGDTFYLIDSADINSIIGNRTFKIAQDTGNTLIVTDSEPPETKNYKYESGDLFFVKVNGKSLSVGKHDNVVTIAKDILETFAGVNLGADLDASWTSFETKGTIPDNISTMKFRVWISEPQSVIQFVLSLFEQVRLEAFLNRDLLLQLTSLHFDNFDPAPSFRVRNFDVVEGSFKPSLDVRNNFNRAQAVFAFLPDINENSQRTAIFRNGNAVTQMKRDISKEVAFPNMYESADVVNQLTEILKLASSGFEHINCELTWRSLLLDIGEFVNLDVKIGSTIYDNVPCLIRDIGYDPEGFKIIVKLWSFQLVPFDFNAGVSGSVGGSTAVITQEPGV